MNAIEARSASEWAAAASGLWNPLACASGFDAKEVGL